MSAYFRLPRPVFRISVFRYHKVLFCPPNIDNVLFNGEYTNINIDAQYNEMHVLL